MSITAQPGPAKDVWLHLLRAGEWQSTSEIRKALPHAYFPNLPSTLDDMKNAGTISLRDTDGRRLWAVTPATKVARGITVRELMAAMPQGEAQ